MRISGIEWKNYRRIPDAQIALRNHGIFVGPNDSGKSSILWAVHLLLGMSAGQLSSAIRPRDFSDVSQPLFLEVSFSDFNGDERAAFPDEIDVGPPETLRIRIEAEVEVGSEDSLTVRRFFPDAGHERALSQVQREMIGWEFVPAARALTRELGGSGTSAVQSLLSGIDLGTDAVALAAAEAELRRVLDSAESIGQFRTELANALSGALPQTVARDDLRIATPANVKNDPLAGMTVTMREGIHDAPLAEQSDGIRALSLLAVLGLRQQAARIVGVDEPETHLHTTAQRLVSRSLRDAAGQRLVVTHSSAVVSQIDPLDIVAFGADRRVRQLPTNATMAGMEARIRHWTHRLVDPLTARTVLLVEGPADRILCQAIAHAIGLDLDRRGVVIFELDGASFFQTANRVLGPGGFGVPLYGLVDEDHRNDWSEVVGCSPATLEESGYAVCTPDLEGMYVSVLGRDRVLNMLLASPDISERSVLLACAKPDIEDVGPEEIAAYCRQKRRKVRAALAVSTGLRASEATAFTDLCTLLQRACA